MDVREPVPHSLVLCYTFHELRNEVNFDGSFYSSNVKSERLSFFSQKRQVHKFSEYVFLKLSNTAKAGKYPYLVPTWRQHKAGRSLSAELHLHSVSIQLVEMQVVISETV